MAGELKKRQKRVILLWLAGASSQLETWDPKPGTSTGGPFRAIDTNVPGVRISELMPKMAKRMDRTAIIRSLNTKNGDHGGAARLMMRGRMDDPSVRYPDMGAVIAKELGRGQSPVPDYVSFYAPTEGRDFAPGASGFLGSRFSPIELTTNLMPENIRRPEAIAELDHVERAELRELLTPPVRPGAGLDGPQLAQRGPTSVSGVSWPATPSSTSPRSRNRSATPTGRPSSASRRWWPVG